MLSDALLLNDGFDCCFPELEVAVAEALGSVVLPVPFTMAVAMMERGFLMSATGRSETGACGSLQICTRAPPDSSAEVGQWPAYSVPAEEPTEEILKEDVEGS